MAGSTIKAIISDLDGVIINSETEHFLSFQKMLTGDYGIHYTKKMDQEFLGTTDVHIFTLLKKRYPQISGPMSRLIKRRTDYFIEIFKKRIKSLPGVVDFFKEIQNQGILLALGTSASKSVMEFALTTLNLKNYFKVMVCADDVTRGKPAPDIYLEAARRLGVNPADCLVIEDSLNGVKAAKSAGMKCVAVPCGPTLSQDLSMADHIVNSISDITPALLKLL